ncbi:alpha/beta hydrolase [Herbidospora sp. RD11066]
MKKAAVAGALAVAAVVLSSPVHAHAKTGSPQPSATVSPTPEPTPTVSSTPPPVRERKTTVRYGRHVKQRMDVYWRANDQLVRPVVFMIHGGWWSGGDKAYMKAITRSYFELGYVVVNVNYRLSGDARWPAQRDDALEAIATTRRMAGEFGLDANRYAVIGFSAGGHIAAAVGTYGDGQPGLRAVVGVSPVISPLTAFSDGGADATHEQRKLRQAAVALAGGCGPNKCPRIWSSMEIPFHASPGDAPMLSVHSAREFVPPYQSELLRESLATYGVNMTVRSYPGTYHSSPLFREPGVAETIQSWVIGHLAY